MALHTFLSQGDCGKGRANKTINFLSCSCHHFFFPLSSMSFLLCLFSFAVCVKGQKSFWSSQSFLFLVILQTKPPVVLPVINFQPLLLYTHPHFQNTCYAIVFSLALRLKCQTYFQDNADKKWHGKVAHKQSKYMLFMCLRQHDEEDISHQGKKDKLVDIWYGANWLSK